MKRRKETKKERSEKEILYWRSISRSFAWLKNLNTEINILIIIIIKTVRSSTCSFVRSENLLVNCNYGLIMEPDIPKGIFCNTCRYIYNTLATLLPGIFAILGDPLEHSKMFRMFLEHSKILECFRMFQEIKF